MKFLTHSLTHSQSDDDQNQTLWFWLYNTFASTPFPPIGSAFSLILCPRPRGVLVVQVHPPSPVRPRPPPCRTNVPSLWVTTPANKPSRHPRSTTPLMMLLQIWMEIFPKGERKEMQLDWNDGGNLKIKEHIGTILETIVLRWTGVMVMLIRIFSPSISTYPPLD